MDVFGFRRVACAMAIHRLCELAASLVRVTTDGRRPGATPARAGAELDGFGGLSVFEGGAHQEQCGRNAGNAASSRPISKTVLVGFDPGKVIVRNSFCLPSIDWTKAARSEGAITTHSLFQVASTATPSSKR